MGPRIIVENPWPEQAAGWLAQQTPIERKMQNLAPQCCTSLRIAFQLRLYPPKPAPVVVAFGYGTHLSILLFFPKVLELC